MTQARQLKRTDHPENAITIPTKLGLGAYTASLPISTVLSPGFSAQEPDKRPHFDDPAPLKIEAWLPVEQNNT